MAGLLSTSEITAFGDILSGHFDTFKRNIVINKEPTKTITSNNSVVYAGYGNESTESIVEFTPKSGVYPAIIVWDDEQITKPLTEIQTVRGAGEIRIKVEEDCRNYINQDRCLSILVDGREFNLLTYDRAQVFCGKTYYVYKLDTAN